MVSDKPTVMHSRFNRIVAVIGWIASSFAVGSIAVSGDGRSTWGYAAAALVCFLAWAALWRPYVAVSGAGVTLRNVSHSVVIPWGELIHVDTRYALTLHTPGRKFSAWAAPAPGALLGARVSRHPSNRESRSTGESLRPGDMIGTESGDAATIVRERWRALIEKGSIQAGAAGALPIARKWDVPVLMTTIALLVATGWALATTG